MSEDNSWTKFKWSHLLLRSTAPLSVTQGPGRDGVTGLTSLRVTETRDMDWGERVRKL